MIRIVAIHGLLAASCFVASGALAIEPQVSDAVCSDAHAQAQAFRKAHKLKSARGQLETCSRQECFWIVQEDCADWLKEVEARIPSVVLVARNTAGEDLVHVIVSMDGAPLVTVLDGQPIDVDPGEHTFVFEAAGRAELTVMVPEGVKARRVTVTLGAGAATTATAHAAISTPATSSSNASADESTFIWTHPGWYLPVGINAGIAFLPGGSTGAILGAEASVVHIDRYDTWIGAYADAAYLTDENAARFSVGPEVGFSILGLDGGFLDVMDHGNNLAGFTLRPMLTIGVLAIYGRWDHTFSYGGGDGGQIGVLVKVPIPLSGQGLLWGVP